MKKPPKALITNDDGIDSYFLIELVHAMKASFDVAVAAPTKEQSWIGKAMSRHRKVEVHAHDSLDCPAWAINGTPC